MSRDAGGSFFIFSWERLRAVSRNLLSLVKLYQKIWIWNLDQNLIMALLVVTVFALCYSKSLQGKRLAIFSSKCLKWDFQDFENV